MNHAIYVTALKLDLPGIRNLTVSQQPLGKNKPGCKATGLVMANQIRRRSLISV